MKLFAIAWTLIWNYLLFAMVHELGHLIVGLAVGAEGYVRLPGILWGAYYPETYLSTFSDALVALSGGLLAGLYFLVGAWWARRTPCKEDTPQETLFPILGLWQIGYGVGEMTVRLWPVSTGWEIAILLTFSVAGLAWPCYHYLPRLKAWVWEKKEG